MSRILLFDLYNTILKDLSFDFPKGMRYLYDTYFSCRCTWEEFETFADSFRPLLEKRTVDHIEISLIRDEVIPMFKKFSADLPEDLEALEFQLMDCMQEEMLLPEVEETLRSFHGRGVPMYILSNTIFSEKATCRLLERFGIKRYFTKAYSSAECGIRKPGRAFFDLAVGEILAEHPECTRDDILYVGNDYITDVTGGMLAELNTVWYNVDHLSDRDGLHPREIDDFRRLLEVLA